MEVYSAFGPCIKYAHQGVRNVSFQRNLAHTVLYQWFVTSSLDKSTALPSTLQNLEKFTGSNFDKNQSTMPLIHHVKTRKKRVKARGVKIQHILWETRWSLESKNNVYHIRNELIKFSWTLSSFAERTSKRKQPTLAAFRFIKNLYTEGKKSKVDIPTYALQEKQIDQVFALWSKFC